MGYPFELPALGYDHDALEPHIDARTMEIHHGKHHQGYTNNLNAALEKYPDLHSHSGEQLLVGLADLPDEIRTAVRNNGGGYVNHTLFWAIMAPGGANEPTGKLAEAIDGAFGSLDELKTSLGATAGKQFGSGWGWLTAGPSGDLAVSGTPNQDNPLSEGLIPILGVDVWEHAYYLNYQNRRPDYISAWWNVVNWDVVATNYANATE
ncbi:MAG: superoxide dismutase [Gemmatimonadetes bacterium]|nr:superoxide dismutase [Gemmatimonadota bacterium]